MDKPPSAGWLDAQISLPLQLPRDIQLEYHSPSNWKKVQSHRHIQADPVSFAYGEGPLQEEDANALAFKEREIVASRKATKAAHKQAAEESLRIRLARLAQEQHAALQKEAPVLSAAGIVVSPAKPQSRAEDSKPEIKPGQRDQSQSEGGVSGASGYVGVEKSREAEQRRYHLEQIQQMLEKRLQGVEASAAVAERARVWLQGKAKELAQSGARFQDEREVRAFGQNDKDPASGCSKGTALGERNKAESRSGFKDSGSMTETKLTVESDAEDDDPLASQSPLPRSVVPKPITRSTTPPKSEASQRYGLEHVSEGRAVRGTHQDFVLSPMSSSGAFTSEDLQGVKAQAQSEIGSLVNEVGSELGVLSLEQSVTSDEEGWLIKNRNPRFAQGETLPDADTELSAHRSYSSQEVAMTSENLYEAEKAVNPSDSRSSIPAVTSCSLSGAATDGQNSEREDLSLRNELLVPHTSGDSSGGADVTAGGADVTTSGDDAHEGTGQEPRNRGGVRKREVFDEHGMGGQYFAAVWRSYSDWERQQGQGWARKQQQAEEQRKARVEHERQLEREAKLTAERRAAQAEERRLILSRQTAEEQRRARAEAERAERALRELENERLSSAMLARLSEKAAASGIQVPPLCGCGHATCPLNPRYTAPCADNCEVRRSWDVYQKTLSDLLYAVGLL